MYFCFIKKSIGLGKISTVILLIFFASVCIYSQESEQLAISEKNNTKKPKSSVLNLGEIEKPEETESDDSEFSQKEESVKFIPLKDYRTEEAEKNF